MFPPTQKSTEKEQRQFVLVRFGVDFFFSKIKNFAAAVHRTRNNLVVSNERFQSNRYHLSGEGFGNDEERLNEI